MNQSFASFLFRIVLLSLVFLLWSGVARAQSSYIHIQPYPIEGRDIKVWLWSGCPVGELQGDFYDITVSGNQVRVAIDVGGGVYPGVCPPVGEFLEYRIPALAAGDYVLVVMSGPAGENGYEWEYGRQAFTVFAAPVPVNDPLTATIPLSSVWSQLLLAAALVLSGLFVVRKVGG
ncbi:MAG: hypothetical protein R3F22_06055 [Lysobacteraceae bacterium]